MGGLFDVIKADQTEALSDDAATTGKARNHTKSDEIVEADRRVTIEAFDEAFCTFAAKGPRRAAMYHKWCHPVFGKHLLVS